MRTSEELTKQGKCSLYPKDIPLSSYNPMRIWKSVQEDITKRLLFGEDLSDVSSELNYQLVKRGYRFENTIQQNNRLYFAVRDINRYVESVRNRYNGNILPLDGEDTVVNVNGEDVEVKGTYFVLNDTGVSVVKVKADTLAQTELTVDGKQQSVDEREDDETYALMMLARKLRDKYVPGGNAQVRYSHLKDNPKRQSKNAEMGYNPEYFSFNEGSDKENIIDDGDYIDEFFREKWDMENVYGTQCGGAECSGCPNVNVCNYVEPPQKADFSGLVKNPDDVLLSHAQRQVTAHNHGVLLVDSGAGAGKTTCITMRLINLLKAGVDPKDIVLLTFTDAAAKEMIDRMNMYVRSLQADGVLPAEFDSNDITATTFNGLCQKVITEHYEELGFDRPPTVVPDEIEKQMVNDVFNLYPDKIPGWSYNKGSKSIYDKSKSFDFLNKDSALNKFLTLVEEIKRVPDGEYKWEPILKLKDADKKPLAHKYVVQLKMMVEDFLAAHTARINGLSESGKAYITYLDQFLLVEKLMKQKPTLWDEYGFKHIIVDEVQDSNTTQLKLLQNIQNNANYESLCCVGDMQQSIYGFNGAVPENMQHDRFEEFFGSDTSYVSIRENFRCARDIIGFVNTSIDQIIAESDKKNIPVASNEYEHLVGTKQEDGEVHVEGYYSQKSQFADVAKKIKADIDNGASPGDIMFITRNKSELFKMADALTKEGVPSVLRCPIPYVENSRVGSAIAFLDSFFYGYLAGYRDYLNCIFHGTLEDMDAEEVITKMNEFKEEVQGKPREVKTIMDYLKALDPECLDECYQSFLQSFTTVKSLADIESRLYAFKMFGEKSTFKREATYDEVQLSTIHSAKGLESPILYADIARLDDPRFHEKRLHGLALKEYKENNRLEYVAYTRAKNKLVVCAPYVLADNRNHPILNKKLIEAYHAVNKTYGYNFMSYMMEKAANKAEEVAYQQEESEELILMPNIDDVKRRLSGGSTVTSMDYGEDDEENVFTEEDEENFDF